MSDPDQLEFNGMSTLNTPMSQGRAWTLVTCCLPIRVGRGAAAGRLHLLVAVDEDSGMAVWHQVSPEDRGREMLADFEAACRKGEVPELPRTVFLTTDAPELSEKQLGALSAFGCEVAILPRANGMDSAADRVAWRLIEWLHEFLSHPTQRHERVHYVPTLSQADALVQVWIALESSRRPSMTKRAVVVPSQRRAG